jgi:cell division transport system permease protein
MFFINILLVLHDVSFRIIDGVNEKLTISLYLDDEYDKNSIEVIDLQNDIKKAIPEIAITYKTKEEVLEEIRERDPELVNILERQNPLPETITLEEIPLKEYENLNHIIENKLFVLTENAEVGGQEYFSTYTRQFERIDKVTSILNILQIGLYIIIATFIISIAVIVYSIIGNFIYYYKDEIYITRLVWGSKLFIYGPFSLQGMMYVGISFIISTLLFLFLLSNLRLVFGLTEFSQIYTGNLPGVLFIEALVFLFVGWASWFLSSRRYLKK